MPIINNDEYIELLHGRTDWTGTVQSGITIGVSAGSPTTSGLAVEPGGIYKIKPSEDCYVMVGVSSVHNNHPTVNLTQSGILVAAMEEKLVYVPEDKTHIGFRNREAINCEVRWVKVGRKVNF